MKNNKSMSTPLVVSKGTVPTCHEPAIRLIEHNLAHGERLIYEKVLSKSSILKNSALLFPKVGENMLLVGLLRQTCSC